MSVQLQGPVTRRSVLSGLGVGVAGVAAAALLGCGSSRTTTTGESSTSKVPVEGATSGGGLPMTAPKVEGKIKDGGTWTTAGTTTLKQHDAHTVLASSVWNYISERTLEPDPNAGTIRPHVVTSWESSDPNGLTLIMKLNPNVKIQNVAPWNGRQFTAEDLAWNLERIGGLYAEKLKIPSSAFQRATMVLNLQKAVAVDPATVKVTLSKPNSAFFNGVMENRTCLMPREMDDIGYKDPRKMAGIGAFMVSEFVDDQRMVFKKNPQYGQFRPGEPHFDEFRQIVVPDTAATQAAFISGQTQILAADTPDSIETVRKGKPDANLYTWVDGNWMYLRPSYDYGPFSDFRVRKAVSLAIDYKATADAYYGAGWGYQAALNPGYPEAWKPDRVAKLPGYNPDTKKQDIAEAQKLISAAGFANGKGIDFSILYTKGDLQNSNVTRFQGQMGAAFPDMKVAHRPVPDSAAFAPLLADGAFQMVGYTNTCVPDAVLEMISQYHSTAGSRNYGHIKEPKIDELLDKAILELNKDARTKLLDEFQQRYMDEWMPTNVLAAQPKKSMLQANIGGYDKVVGPWFQYSSNGQAGRWYYVEK